MSVRRFGRRAPGLAIASGLVFGAALLAPAPPAAPAPPPASARAAVVVTPLALNIVEPWGPITLNDAQKQIVFSSPMPANLDGRLAFVVGDRKGRLLAYHIDNGTPVWAYNAGAAIDAPASVAPIGPGGRDVVFVGVGTGAAPSFGGYLAVNPSGTRRWYVPEIDPSTNHSRHHGVQSGLAVGSLQGLVAVVGGSMGQNQDALNTPTGHILHGFPWFQGDSNLTTPAIADVFGNGKPVIIEGGDSSPGLAYGVQYPKGGHMRVLSPNGYQGHPYPNGGQICDRPVDEIVRSSPAVGQFTTRGTMVAVFGTGTHFMGKTTNHIVAINARTCQGVWEVALDGDTTSSPALADLFGNGHQEVVEATRAGSVYAFEGNNHGHVLWHEHLPSGIIGSVVTADLRNTGHQDVIVPTVHGVYILDGKTGTSLGMLPGTEGLAFQNAPLVTGDPNGRIGITVAGYNGYAQGVIRHYEIVGSHASSAAGRGAWPMFHHDRRLRGFAPLP